MKRLLTGLLVLWSTTTMAGLAPTTLQGDSGTAIGTPSFKVPNQQATKVGTSARIETGNTNLLQNPSFEHSTVNIGWGSPSLGTVTAENTIVVDGKQSIRLNSAGAGTRMVQVSTINAAYLKGQQMVARVKIDTNDTALYVCAVVDNITTGDTNCTLVPVTTTDMPFKQIEIPFIGGGTSNGIVIKSATTTSTNTYIDDAFVGTMPPFQAVSGAKLMGTIKITCSGGSYSTTSTSYVDYSAQTGCTYVTSGQAQAPSTMIPAIKFASIPAGDLKLEAEGDIGSDVINKTATFQFWDGTNAAREESYVYGSASLVELPGINQSISYSTTQSNVTLSIRAKASSVGNAYVGAGSASPLVIRVWYFPPESRIYSQASQDYDWTDAGITSSTTGWLGFNGGGTITSISIQKKRKGGDLYLRGSFVAPSGMSNSAFRIPLPDSLTIKTGAVIDAPFGNFTASTAWGSQQYSLGSHANGNGYIEAFNWGSGGGYSLVTGNAVMPSAGTFYFNAGPIPISQWSDYGVIVGSFAGIEKCADDYECTDKFSAKVSSTTITDQTLNWLASTTAYSSGNATGTFVAGRFTATPNCLATSASGNGAVVRISSVTTSGYVVNCTDPNAAACAADYTIECNKTGVDYKPKTAKVASSTNIMNTPGSVSTRTGAYIANITSAGVVTEYGGADWINGNCVNNTSSNFQCTINAGIFTSTPICFFGTPTNNNSAVVSDNDDGLTTSTLVTYKTWSITNTAVQRPVKVICIGSY